MRFELVEGSMKNRIQKKDKKLLNCQQIDVNQLMPIKYHWAWEHFLNGCANHWVPEEVAMGDDIALWKSNELTPAERKLLIRNCGFFSTEESLVATNLSLAVYKYVTNAECRQYLLRQAFEEAIHTHTFVYICDSLALDAQEVFNMYREIPSVANKDAFQIKVTSELLKEGFSTATFEGSQKFLENLIAYYVILEGIFFYSGFAMILSFQRQNKFKGIAQLFEFILRDETIHLNFGIDLIHGIKEENPKLWSTQFQNRILKLIQEGVELEIAYTWDCLPTPILGLDPHHVETYVKYIADRRLERLGLKAFYKVENPLAWMSEVMDLVKEKNFFESTVTEYRPSSELKWE